MAASIRLLAVAVAGALLLAGCDKADDELPATTGGSPSTRTEPGGGIDAMAGASTVPVTVPATNAETALLADVRAARHEGFDRVVLEFRNVLPGYDVRYVDPPVYQDGSGAEVRVEGAAVVRVRLESALDADLTQESAPRTYTGPNRFSPGTPQVVELVRAGGFEGVLTWVVGLGDRVDFRVLTLEDPPRLVLDFRHH